MPLLKHTRNWIRVACTLGIALIALSLCELWDISSAVDGAIRTQYYRYAPLRLTGQRVVLVHADHRTYQHWGPLPWASNQIESLVSSIRRGHPSLIVVIDRDEFMRGEPFLPDDDFLNSLVEEGKLIFVRSGGIHPSPSAPLQYLHVQPDHNNPPLLLPTVLSRSALPPIHEDQLPIHYVSPPSLLPSLALHRVANQEFPSDTFTGKIVLIAAGQTPWSTRIATPVGPLLASEIYAHALLGLADGAIWTIPDRITVVMGSLLFFAIVLFLNQRWALMRPTFLLLFSSLGILLLDYWAFSHSIALIGPTIPSLGIIVLSSLSSYQQHQTSLKKLNGLGKRLQGNVSAVPVESQSQGSTINDQEAFWQDLVVLGRTYFRQEVTAMIAELPHNEWHLKFRAAAGCKLAEIEERRRDIRRSPFRTPYLTHRANWIDGFLSDRPRTKTLLIPLHFDARLYGFWLLFTDNSNNWSHSDVLEAEKLGVQIARTIAQKHRAEPEAANQNNSNKVASVENINVIDDNLQRLHHERDWSFELLRLHPQGMLVSTLWGKIEFINAAMNNHLREEFPNGIPGNDIRAVLARLSGTTLDQAHSMMRQVVLNNRNVTVTDNQGQVREISGEDHLILQKLSMTMSPDLASNAESTITDSDYLVLLAKPVRASPPKRLMQRS